MITSETIVTAAAIITALLTIGGAAWAIIKWVLKQQKQDEDIAEIKAEQYIIDRALFACLDGLIQLNCNGNVTKMHDELEEHLNRKAHQ